MNKTTRNLVFSAFYVALAIILSYLNKIAPIIQMPNGGSLELMVIPIFVASYHLGWKYGMGVGILSWAVGMLFGLNDYMIAPLQVVFDYVAPVLTVGMAAIFPSIRLGKWRLSNIYIGIILGMVLRYGSQVISGTYFWPGEGAAGSLPALIFALNYNLLFNLATLVAALIITPVIIRILRQARPKEFVGIKD